MQKYVILYEHIININVNVNLTIYLIKQIYQHIVNRVTRGQSRKLPHKTQVLEQFSIFYKKYLGLYRNICINWNPLRLQCNEIVLNYIVTFQAKIKIIKCSFIYTLKMVDYIMLSAIT